MCQTIYLQISLNEMFFSIFSISDLIVIIEVLGMFGVIITHA